MHCRYHRAEQRRGGRPAGAATTIEWADHILMIKFTPGFLSNTIHADFFELILQYNTV
jgi:hypothetical protein